jgi:hypothetical protein
MSSAEGISLLAHLQTPLLVGDPDGCIVYANQTFRERFCTVGQDPMGQPLAMVFGGGAREVVLTATAEVLERGQSARLQLREGDYSYTGLASPIVAEDDRVGVIMVLLEEQTGEDHLNGLVDEIGEPIAEATKVLQGLSQNPDCLLADDQQKAVERGLRSIETAQKWLHELQVAIRGGKPQAGRFDVANAILRVTERIRHESDCPIDLEVLMPPNLPRVVGAPIAFERTLTQLIQHRIGEARSGQSLTLLARTLGGDTPESVLVSVVDLPDSNRRHATGYPPDAISQGDASMGGEIICVEDSTAGRVTLMRLAVATS